MRLVGLRLRLHRTVTHILHAERCSDDQNFIKGAACARLQNHATHARIKRQFGQLLADDGQLMGIIDRAEFGQQLVTVRDGTTRGPLDEGKVLDRAQVQGLHTQDHTGQRTAQNLRLGVACASVEIQLRVQPDANTVGDPAAATSTLIGR